MILERLLRRTDFQDGCWIWTGTLNTSDYGQITYRNTNRLVHRIGFELAGGTVPDGMQIDHLCRKRNCWNPSHLEAVTNRENALRSERATKTHCVHGHPFTDENTVITIGNQGFPWRSCRICRRQATKRYQKRRAS